MTRGHVASRKVCASLQTRTLRFVPSAKAGLESAHRVILDHPCQEREGEPAKPTP
jgi:hypothetical protein